MFSKKYFLFIVLILNAPLGHAFSSRIGYLGSFHLPAGGIDPENKSLQSETDLGIHRILGDIFLGEKLGFIFGASYGTQRMSYVQTASSERSSGRFKSDYSTTMLRLGYWARLYQKHKIEVVGSWGRGRFSFKDLNTKERASPYISSYMLDIDLSFFLTELYNSKIDLIFGLGLYKNDIKKIHLGAYDFSRKDFAEDGFLSIGLGVNL